MLRRHAACSRCGLVTMENSAVISNRNKVHSEVLSGWKEIANYLEKGVRTIQRYEHRLSLPVRRPAGKPRGSVLATKSELDGWLLSAHPVDHPELPKPTALRQPELASLHQAIDQMRNLRQQIRQLQADCRAERKTLREKVALLMVISEPISFMKKLDPSFGEHQR